VTVKCQAPFALLNFHPLCDVLCMGLTTEERRGASNTFVREGVCYGDLSNWTIDVVIVQDS
jgi:hypothetical protein